ncbi:MAG TPA: hypothetical protein VMW40_08345 [Candidatus Bathyarchaeia archaeon]|nr:hypothetical protein [Candidatus Bathyarchaeia archaeon]
MEKNVRLYLSKPIESSSFAIIPKKYSEILMKEKALTLMTKTVRTAHGLREIQERGRTDTGR